MVLFLLAAAGHAQDDAEDDENLSPEELPTLDFSLPEEKTRKQIEQVISGALVVRGTIEVQKMQDIRLVTISALSKVCENRSAPVIADITQDIASFGSERPAFLVEWSMLPPIGGGFYCMDSLAMISYGKAEPPFDPVVGPPPFRDILQMEFRGHAPTMWLALDNWVIELGNFTCNFRKTIGPEERAYTEYTTTPPPGGTLSPPEACQDGDPLLPKWTPPDKVVDPPPLGSCTLANNACVCAALTNCTWVANDGGGWWCQPRGASEENVPCSHCPLQARCPMDQAAVCSSVITPCGCVESTGRCRWDIEKKTCVLRGDGETPCAACTDQGFCTKPAVIAMSPPGLDLDYVVMGEEMVGWLVNITFNRRMRTNHFMYLNPFAVQLKCRAIVEVRYTNFTIDWRKVRMVNNGTTLQIDVSGTANNKLRECDVVIAPHVLHDDDHVSYDGMQLEELLIAVDDCTSPVLTSFFPQNSETGVTLNTTVTMFFDEAVLPTGNASNLTLTELGGSWEGGRTGADVVVAEIDLTGKRAVFDDTAKSLTVDFSGLILPTVLYSLSIGAGGLSDASGNTFAGILPGLYQFRTETEPWTMEEGGPEKEPVLPLQKYGAYAAAGGATLGCFMAMTSVICKICSRKRKLRKVQRLEGQPQPLHNWVPEPLTAEDAPGSTFKPRRGPLALRSASNSTLALVSPDPPQEWQQPGQPGGFAEDPATRPATPVASPSLRGASFGDESPSHQPSAAWPALPDHSPASGLVVSEVDQMSPKSMLTQTWQSTVSAQSGGASPTGTHRLGQSLGSQSAGVRQLQGHARNMAFAVPGGRQSPGRPAAPRRPKSALW